MAVATILVNIDIKDLLADMKKYHFVLFVNDYLFKIMFSKT